MDRGQHHQHRHRHRDPAERAAHQPAVDGDDPGNAAPTITLVKTADIATFASAGTPVTYSYLVTNTGNVTLTALAVTDPMPGLSAGHLPGPSLSPGGSETCTATYTTTQADVDRGAIVNTGTASGTPPSGPAVTANSTVTVPAVQAPGINLEKSANVNSFSAAGTVVTYSYTVTNTGNTTLTQVVVTDPMPGLSAITCPFTSLAPAARRPAPPPTPPPRPTWTPERSPTRAP